MFLCMVKTLKLIVKTNVFYVLEGCMCEREMYQKTSKVRPKSMRKSMTNLYKNHARKRDNQNMETHQTNDPKRR